MSTSTHGGGFETPASSTAAPATASVSFTTKNTASTATRAKDNDGGRVRSDDEYFQPPPPFVLPPLENTSYYEDDENE